MNIHKEGYIPIIVILLLVLVILGIINVIFPEQGTVHIVLYSLGTVFMFMVIRFFRFPRRIAVPDKDVIYSAADGNVVAIEKVKENEYFQREMVQVSVFMSPLNVHVNWLPISGRIIYQKHHPGRHYPAYTPKSSLENEMNTTVIRDEQGREMMVRQIAGIMARRIVCIRSVDDEVKQGKELGIVKFGSRVDLFIDPEATVYVKLGQPVRACRDVIARY